MQKKELLRKINFLLQQEKIDYFIQPNSDEFFLEYLPQSEKRIEYLSGFTGSNASIIITKNKCKFFTDGRYILQAKNELNKNDYEIFNIATTPLLTWLAGSLKKSERVAIDAKLCTIVLKRHHQKFLFIV
jgi:Xaa-Pro aminopeptidase